MLVLQIIQQGTCMIKLILLIVLVLLIMIVAKYISQQYKDRYRIYCDIVDFFDNYKLNVGFKKEKLKSLIKDYTDKATVLGSYNNFLATGKFDLSSVKLLTAQEKSQLKEYFVKLGNGDYETEKNFIEIAKAYFNSKVEETKKIKDKWCPLIIKLTFLFALGVAILFI